MKKLQLALASFVAIVGLAVVTPVLTASPVAAGDAASEILKGTSGVGGDDNKVKLEDQIKIVVNVLLFLLGAIAVIMIIIGGIRYATSNGDSSSTKAAKDTILYAVIGLVVAIMAYAIVNFIVGTAFGGK